MWNVHNGGRWCTMQVDGAQQYNGPVPLKWCSAKLSQTQMDRQTEGTENITSSTNAWGKNYS